MRIIVLGFVLLIIGSYVPVFGASQDQDQMAVDAFIARAAQRERGEEYADARKVVVGDLNGDKVPETIVLYTIEGQGGSNNHVQYLAVFERRNGSLVAITLTPVGGKSRRSVELLSVENQRINLKTLSYGPKDASCCPSVKGMTSYQLAGRTLREFKRRTGS